MSSSKAVSLWGLNLHPGRTEFVLPEQYDLHITNATLGASTTKEQQTGRASVIMTIPKPTPSARAVDPVATERMILLTLLPNKVEHLMLNVLLIANKGVTLEVIGTHAICLIGNYVGSEVPLSADTPQPLTRSILKSVPPAPESLDELRRKRVKVEPEEVTIDFLQTKINTASGRPQATLPLRKPPAERSAEYIGAPPPAFGKPPAGRPAPDKPRGYTKMVAPDLVASESSASESSAVESSVAESSTGGDLGLELSTPRRGPVVGDKSGRPTAESSRAQIEVEDRKIGNGTVEARKGDVLYVWYRLVTERQVVLQSCIDGKALRIILGDGTLLDAIEDGMIGMVAGGERLIKIPSSLGYGNKQHGDLPPNSMLFFQCKVVRVERPARS